MKICVLGTHSLVGAGPKVGIQHIAETLADFGHDVVYVTSHASPLMLLLPAHRARYLRSDRPLRLTPNLRQLTPVNLLPARLLRRLESAPGSRILTALDRKFEHTRGRVLEQERFDICICSSAATMTLVDRIRAPRLYYRLNDLLGRFRAVPVELVKREATLLRSGRLDGVWAVNAQLAKFSAGLASGTDVHVVPNGVASRLFADAVPDAELAVTRARNVIYVGAVEFWIDVELLVNTALLLPDHLFHIFGPWGVPLPHQLPPNVVVHGPIAHAAIASKLTACTVGIIPAGTGNFGRMVEKPLKFYEYLAAGLGVAATSQAGTGLEPFAVIGDTPETFADAIVRAKSVSTRYAVEAAAAVTERDWRVLVKQMLPDA